MSFLQHFRQFSKQWCRALSLRSSSQLPFHSNHHYSHPQLYIYSFREGLSNHIKCDDNHLCDYFGDTRSINFFWFSLVCACVSYYLNLFKNIYKRRYDKTLQAMRHHICTVYFLVHKEIQAILLSGLSKKQLQRCSVLKTNKFILGLQQQPRFIVCYAASRFSKNC